MVKSRGGVIMCKQISTLKKLRKKGTVDNDVMALAEAQAEDYVEMNKRLTSIESKVAEIENGVSRIDGKLDALMQQVNSPTEAYKIDGAVWREIRKSVTSWKGGLVIILAIGIIALAGQRILELFKIVPLS